MQLNHRIEYLVNKHLLTYLNDERYLLSFDHHHKLLWYRVPKVATRALNQYFEETIPQRKYVYCRMYVSYLKPFYTKYFKFAFVRHPADRLLSCWRNKVRDTNFFGFPPDQREKMQDFSHFIDWVGTQNLETAERHIRLQSSLIDMEEIDFLGRFEQLPTELKRLEKRTPLPRIDLPKRNITRKKSSERITDRQRKKIETIYWKDYEVFNY